MVDFTSLLSSKPTKERERKKRKNRRSMKKTIVIVAVLVIISCYGITEVRSDASDHRYKEGDPVPLYANKVGPFHNPRYVTLSFPFLSLLFRILDLI